MLFRPTFWPTLITIPALALLLALGGWQVQRLQWKADLIRELEIRGSAAAIPLPLNDRIAAEDLAHRRVTVTGRYMYEAEMHLLNRVRDGVPGIHVVTPLIRADGGGTILVDRGWVPLDWPGTPYSFYATGAVTLEVTGVVRIPEEPGMFTPDNRSAKNEWYYMDLAAMSGAAGVLPFIDYYLYATAERLPEGVEQAGAAPDPNEWRVDLPNNHLHYAITWFSLAAVLLVVYVVYHMRLPRLPPDDD